MVDQAELTALLRASRHRVLHLIGGVAVVLAAITVVAIARVVTSDGELSSLIAWCVGCAGFGLAATLWYRARVKAIAQLATAVANGWKLYRCQMTAVAVRRIPLGHEVDMIAVDAARTTSVPLAFGFWTEASAARLLEILMPHAMAGAPPALPIKMRAPVR